jgi:hypothetical protein
MTVAFVLALMILGIMEASMTRRPSIPRAVQRSIHDAHGEDRTDAAEGDAMPTI